MPQREETQRTDTKDERADYWLTPDQVQRMKNAIIRESQDFVTDRNGALLQTLYDTGLRNAELVALDVDMLRLDDDEPHIAHPASIQKDVTASRWPKYTEMTLDDQTVTDLDRYLSNRWKDYPAL